MKLTKKSNTFAVRFDYQKLQRLEIMFFFFLFCRFFLFLKKKWWHLADVVFVAWNTWRKIKKGGGPSPKPPPQPRSVILSHIPEANSSNFLFFCLFLSSSSSNIVFGWLHRKSPVLVSPRFICLRTFGYFFLYLLGVKPPAGPALKFLIWSKAKSCCCRCVRVVCLTC